MLHVICLSLGYLRGPGLSLALPIQKLPHEGGEGVWVGVGSGWGRSNQTLAL